MNSQWPGARVIAECAFTCRCQWKDFIMMMIIIIISDAA